MATRKANPTPEEKDLWETETPETPRTPSGNYALDENPQATKFKQSSIEPDQYDIDGLMTDFPTAKELERFVFDETGIVLSLKGRANKLKYQVAMDALNGVEVDPKFIGSENPYIDKADMVPIEELKEPPENDRDIPAKSHLQNTFHSRQVPHPDTDLRAQGRWCDVTFRKYDNGMITYEIIGPIDQRPHGEKMDKYGRTRPEIIKWVDPRSGEQVVQYGNGVVTPMGKRLRALMQLKKVNNTNFWAVWIDRDFANMESDVLSNPWAIE